MGQVETAPRLAFHVAQHRAVVDDQLGKEFERDIAFEFFIARQPDDAHAAAAERLDQSVAVEDFLPVGKVSRSRIQAVAGSPASHALQINDGAGAHKAKNPRSGGFQTAVGGFAKTPLPVPRKLNKRSPLQTKAAAGGVSLRRRWNK